GGCPQTSRLEVIAWDDGAVVRRYFTEKTTQATFPERLGSPLGWRAGGSHQKTMNRNLGEKDRIVRATVGWVTLFVVGVCLKNSWGVLGLYPLVTARLAWCPVLRLCGFDTGYCDHSIT